MLLYSYQGKTPHSDFRGMGILSLSFMIYISRHYPDLLKRNVRIFLLIYNIYK